MLKQHLWVQNISRQHISDKSSLNKTSQKNHHMMFCEFTIMYTFTKHFQQTEDKYADVNNSTLNDFIEHNSTRTVCPSHTCPPSLTSTVTLTMSVTVTATTSVLQVEPTTVTHEKCSYTSGESCWRLAVPRVSLNIRNSKSLGLRFI